MASSKAFPEQRSCAMTALRRFPHRSDTCSHPCRCRGPDSWGIFSLSKPEPYVTWMRNFSHTGFSACCVECEQKRWTQDIVILRRSRRTSCNIVELRRRLRGSSSKNQVLTYSGRGALPRASSQTLLQEVLRLGLR